MAVELNYMPQFQDLAVTLKQLRLMYKLLQATVAEMANINPITYTRYEKGGIPSTNRIYRLAAVYHLTPFDLLLVPVDSPEHLPRLMADKPPPVRYDELPLEQRRGGPVNSLKTQAEHFERSRRWHAERYKDPEYVRKSRERHRLHKRQWYMDLSPEQRTAVSKREYERYKAKLDVKKREEKKKSTST